jgi:type I restriction enzyme S subunit
VSSSQIAIIKPIPSGWTGRRLKHAVVRVVAKTGDAELPYVGLDSISSWSGAYLPGSSEQGEGAATVFVTGDVLFGKLRPYLAKAWAAEFQGRCTSEALVLRPRSLESRYLQYLLLSPRFIDLVDASTYGAKMPRAEWDFIGDIVVPVPPRDLQRIIVQFLDHKTAAIDDLIAKKERLIELLEEKRQALITQAVTKGLDPGVRMRDSSVAWMGRVPANWTVAKIGQLARVRNGSTPSRSEYDYWDGGIVPWLSSGKVNDYIVTEADQFVTEKALRECSIEIMPAGAVIVGMIGEGKTRGTSAIMKIPASINQNMAAIVAGTRLRPWFLLHALTAAYLPLREFGRGGQQDALNCEILSAFRIPLPPLEEQESIVSWIDAQTARADEARAELSRSIAKLREYRQALITAAVTGQIDVRSLASERDDVVEKVEADGGR